jgi:hypothetical protein
MNNQGIGAERLRRQGGTFTAPSHFTPIQGLLSVGRVLASRLGLSGLWAGEDGFEGVARQKLTEIGIPESVPIKALTPRQFAEQAGLIKKPRARRRLKR